MKKVINALMQDLDLRKALGKRIKRLRKEKNLTQKQLAQQVDTSPAQLNKYESGVNAPPVEKLLLLAEVLGCSIDFLVAGNNNSAKAPINNQRLAHRFQVIDELELEDKELIIKVLDAMITKSKLEATMAKFGSN